MANYTFIKKPDESNIHDISTVTVEVNTPSLPEILEEIEAFLHASGFRFKGKLEFVEDTDDE